MNGSIVTLSIIESWKICLQIYQRYFIGITRNGRNIYRIVPCSPRSHLDSGATIEDHEEWSLRRWSHQVKRDMTFLMSDHCSPSIVRSKPFIQIQGIFETSSHLCLSDHRSPQLSHLLESFNGVTRANDTTFFTCKNLCFPIETLYTLNLCHSS